MQNSIDNKKTFVLIIAAIVAIIALAFSGFSLLNMRVGKIILNTNIKYANRLSIEQKLVKLVHQRFWLVDLNAATSDLYADSWLEKVELKRSVFGVLQVNIVEKTPIGVWNDAYLLDTNFEFIPMDKKIAQNLLHIYSPKANILEVGKFATNLNLLFNSYGIKFNKMVYSKSGLYTLNIENNLLIELGKNDIELKLSRFFRAWQSYLKDNKGKISEIDLRYPNGLAFTEKAKGNL